MNKITIIMIIALIMMLGHAKAEEVSAEELQRKIDKLETELEKLRIEVSESNPLQNGEPRNWGKGWFFQAFSSGDDNTSIDIGYSKVLDHWKPFWQAEYLEGRTGYRIAVSLGAQFVNDVVIDAKNSDIYESEWVAGNLTTSFGTPVMLNFISFCSDIKLMYIHSLEDDDKNIIKDQMGICFGAQGEIWLSSKSAFVIGYRNESPDIGATTDNDRRDIISDKFYPTFGFKKYF